MLGHVRGLASSKNAELVQERLEVSGELQSPVLTDGANLEAEGCDVRFGDIAPRRRGVALPL